MDSDPQTPAALAPRAESAPLAEQHLTLSGGVGLYDHSARDPFPGSAGLLAGVGALLLTAIAGYVLFSMNQQVFASGKAGGTANQLAAVAAAAQLAPGSPEFEGRQIIGSKPCAGCHTIPGVAGATGTVGPNLAGVASRPKIAGGAVNNSGPADLAKWISDPPSVKPGTAMPKVPLAEDELTKVVAFLETLK